MAIYQDVSPGEKVVNSAQRYNDINRLLNAAQGVNESFSAGRDFSKIKVYNANNERLLPGWAVMFVGGRIIDGACPVERATNQHYRYGILTEQLDSFCFGTAVVSGPAEVDFVGSGEYALPSGDGKRFEAAASGLPILCQSDGKAVVLLGGGSDSGTAEYQGYFKIKQYSQTEEDMTKNQIRVKVYDSLWALSSDWAGWAIINDIQISVPAAELTVTRSNPYVVLRYNVERKSAEIRTVSELNAETPWFVDYIIGELVTEYGQPAKVVQRHSALLGNGTISFWTASDICSWEYQG